MDNMDTQDRAINISVKEPTPSSVLLEIVSRINKAYGHLKDEVMTAYNQAISEGFSPQGAKRFIFENTEFCKRTIYRYLPEEAKSPNLGRPLKGTLPTGKVTQDEELEKLSNNVSELATFVSENKPKHKLDRMKQYAEELRSSEPSNIGEPNEFSKELKRCANKVKLIADSLDKIKKKSEIYKPQDPERDRVMAQALNDTVTDGIFRTIGDYFRVVFGEWWTEFEKKYGHSETDSTS
jgi:hypothetical protein